MSASRVPTEAPEPRMEPLARLPIFLTLDGKRVIVAGNGAPAAWKAELLSAASAVVDIFVEGPCDELQAISAPPPRGPVTIYERCWSASDFTGAAIAVGSFDDDREAERFTDAAHRAGVPVNVIDKPAFCDFAFGSIVNRSPLVIGISTDGAAPVFAQAIRAKLEAMIPRGFARWVAAAQRWRAAVKSSGLGVFRTQDILAIVHHFRSHASEPGTRAGRFRSPHGGHPQRGALHRSGLGHAGGGRPG